MLIINRERAGNSRNVRRDDKFIRQASNTKDCLATQGNETSQFMYFTLPVKLYSFCAMSQIKVYYQMNYAECDAAVFSLAAPANNYILSMSFRPAAKLFSFPP